MKTIKGVFLICLITFVLFGCQKTERYMEEGIAFLQQENYKEAARSFESALQERSAYTSTTEEDILLYCGEAYFRAGDLENAIRIYKQMIDKDLESEEVYGYLGYAQYKSGLYEDAKNSYLKAVALQPDNQKWQLYMGLCLLEQQQYESALPYFEQGLTLPMTEETVQQALLYHQAVCYEYLGDFVKARELFSSYVLKYPEDEAARKEYEFLLSR